MKLLLNIPLILSIVMGTVVVGKYDYAIAQTSEIAPSPNLSSEEVELDNDTPIEPGQDYSETPQPQLESDPSDSDRIESEATENPPLYCQPNNPRCRW